ncbi:hypothetical protein BD769DRAFT_136827 [Suillus cothurnatus]|nr:hypothetical protein BD769DRAFT_136827 [Suillus cothurnatus]
MSSMVAEPEPAVVEVACDLIEAEANPMEARPSSVGDEPAVTETAPVSIDSVAETAPEVEPRIMPTTLEAAPIKSIFCEVVVEENLAYEADAEFATTLEPTPEATESEPIGDTAEPGTEVAESEPTEETVPVTEAVTTTAPGEISGIEAEESAEVDARIAAEKEANEESQGAIDAEDEPVAPTESEVEVFVPEVVSAPAEAATGPDVLSTQSEEAAIAPTTAPEVSIEYVIAAEAESDAYDFNATVDSDPVTVPDSEPITATETNSAAAAGSEPAAVESEVPAAVYAELTEPAVESIVAETVQIDVEPPSSNVSFVEDPEVDFAYADEPQTPLAEEMPVLGEPVLDVADVQSEMQVEESSAEEIVEVIPVDVVTPTGESASVEEVTAEEVVAVEEVVTVEEFPVEGPAAVEETVLAEETVAVEETIPVEEVVPVDVTTGEPAPIEEVPSVEAVSIEEHAPVEDITLVDEVIPSESVAPIESSPSVEEAVDDKAEPAVEEPVAPVDDGPVLDEAMLSVYAVNVAPPLPSVDVPSLEEPTASVEEPLMAPEEVFAETAVPATEDISLAGGALTIEEISAHLIEVPIGEDVPAAEERSTLAEVDVPESGTIEELSTSVEKHTFDAVKDTQGHEDQPVAIDENSADAVEPVSVDDCIPPTMDETPLPADVPALEATSTTEEESVTVVVSDETISEAAVVASVKEDILVVEEPLSVEMPETVVHEEVTAPTGDHELVTVEDTPVPDDQPVTIEEAPATEEPSISVDDQIPPAMNEIPPIAEVLSAADEPTLDSPTEERFAPEDEPTTTSVVGVLPIAGEATAVPEEITSKAEETIPVFEAALTIPADPIFDDASSSEGTTQSTVEPDASETELPVAVEEPAPAASEVSVVKVILTEVHAAVEHTEDTLFASEEIKDEIEYHQHAEAPVSLSEQPLVEEYLPIVEEFAPVPAGELESLEELHVVTSQFPVNGEHSEVGKDLEPSVVHVETSSEIEETEVVEQPETTAVEEVTEQQEIATSPALNVATDIERPKSPWTPSYSVIVQGPVVPEISADIEVSGQTQVEVLQLAEEQVTLGEPEEPCLKSPWTPSYSVTVQGNVTQINEDLDDLEQLPPSVTQ